MLLSSYSYNYCVHKLKILILSLLKNEGYYQKSKNYSMPKWVSAKKARLIVGVHTSTLRRWDAAGKIKTKRTPGDHRLYDIEPFLGPSEAPVCQANKEGIIYARVSSKKQIADLEPQVEHLQVEFPGYKVIRDVGSGINWKRRGLRTLLRSCMSRNVREVVVAHRDRLSRLAFDILKFIIEESGAKLVVHDAPSDLTPAEELGEDLLSIIHVFSCRSYGKRTYRKKKESK